MRFHYIASQPNGRVVEGDLEVQGSAEVLEYLANQGLRPISLKVLRGVEQASGGRLLGQKITIADKVFLTKYLALMLKVGTDLFKAINILVADFDKPAMRAFLSEIENNLKKGQPFYLTFAKYPKYFSAVFVNLVRAGESSGSLEKVFGDLSEYLQNEQELRNQIKSAFIYPVILLIASVFILVFLVTFALPKIAGVFTSSGINPPLFSKIVFAVGLFIGQYVWLFLAFFIGLVGSAWYVFARTTIGRKIIYQFFTKLPAVNNVVKRLALQRFASTLASLLHAGLPLVDSLEITADAVGFEEFKAALLRISREGISKGLTVGDAFRQEGAFPRVVVNLIAISEKAGHLEEILGTLANFYESEIKSSIRILVTFLEPILLLSIGFIIAVIALAIIVPIYQLVGKF